MSKAKAYAVAIVPGGDFYQGGNPNDAEAQLPAAAPKVEKDKGGKERASAYIDFFDEHQNVKGDWWKCSNCEKAIRNAAPKKLYDEIKSHLLCMHDNEPASRSDTRTIAEVCFPVSVIIHREKMAAERLKRGQLATPAPLARAEKARHRQTYDEQTLLEVVRQQRPFCFHAVFCAIREHVVLDVARASHAALPSCRAGRLWLSPGHGIVPDSEDLLQLGHAMQRNIDDEPAITAICVLAPSFSRHDQRKAQEVARVAERPGHLVHDPRAVEGVQILDYARPQQQLRLLQQHTIACEHG
jgi:hypothetical protein